MPAPPISPSRPIGFTRTKREGDDQEAINRMFAPEFRNRLDATITFAHLSQEIIAKVVEKFVLQLEAQLGDRNVTIELSEEAARWLIANGYDELMGARPMARVIQEHIKKPLADEVLFGHLKGGGHVRVVVAKDEAGRDQLGFEYPEGPITPKPEKLPAVQPKAKRRSSPRPGDAQTRLGAESAADQGLTIPIEVAKREAGLAKPGLRISQVLRAMAAGAGSCTDNGAMGELSRRMPAPSTFNSSSAAFFGGVKSALTSVFFLVLTGTYIGIGALAHDFGFASCWLALSTMLVWAAPAQVILVSALGTGAAPIEAADRGRA